MKTNLLASQFTRKTILLALSLFFMNNLSAQLLNKFYATSQSNQVVGICLGCGVLNPEYAVDNYDVTYSTLQVSVGLIARTEQTLIFDKTNIAADTNKLIIGFGTDKTMLAAQIATSVTIETFNGGVSNNDYQTLNSSNLNLGGTDPSRGEIEITMNKPFDRVKVNLNGGLLSLNAALRLYYAYQYKDPHITFKANSTDGQITLDGKIPFEGSEVSLINTFGREVYHGTLKSNTFESRQPEGIYILKVQTKEGKIYSNKIIIK
ncbi:T9SS type A sorting domain-containing protein [Chryseobacterium sp. PMSZPI]|uniref:T9SS type A sorting domain-containing protein n=1 Tax=Chryseobacterium sp. PMSZPI TaxID=1033900 RepID=UPI000C342672|nr:T9SS type A sorting domain-containing protein [Chryseobacterium sp. PMSZPI]PKF75494.1 hypothetical protein CW752_04010 [Chryseobacterium sp. PMSZPI]